MMKKFKNWFRKRKFREGTTITRFVARDIRREIQIFSADRIEEGIISGRVRTTNILYLCKNLVPESEFGDVEDLKIDKIWEWSGKNWGGLSDGTSIVNQPGSHEH